MSDSVNEAWYAAFKAKDSRFDGRIFVGVSSTGIYCRPVCRAKLPKAENCIFFVTAAAAEQAGYRPCLLCRPELAPGSAPIDNVMTLVQRAARLMEENCGSDQSLEELAQSLGCSGRHLRRAFAAEYNVSPVQYLQTCRLLLAKNLLTETDLSVLEVAMAAGFGSLRRFNDLFKKQYQLAPTELRRQIKNPGRPGEEVSLSLGYRPPYQWRQMLDFLALRAIPGVEVIENDAYLRTVHLSDREGRHVCGWIKVAHRKQKNALSITVDTKLLPVLSRVLARVRRLFDLACQPETVFERLAVMNNIRPGLCVLGARLPGCFDAFEMTVRAVLGQQITVKAAGTLAGRLAEAYGKPLQTGIMGLMYIFPTPADITSLEGPIAEHFGPLGITSARAGTILHLARAFEEGLVDFVHSAQPGVEMLKLKDIPGIGDWTAQYIGMRAMNWPDAFLHTDKGVKKALIQRTAKEILALAENWRPYRSYAVINLWNSL